MKTALFASGEIDDYGMIATMASQFQTIVAVDSGLRHCLALELVPQIIIGETGFAEGDLSSFFPGIKVVPYSKDKEESGLELAIDFCNFELSPQVTIFGGTRGYTDLTIGNLLLLKRYQNEDLRFATDDEILFALKPGYQIIECPEGFRSVSLLPLFGEAVVEKTAGLKWDLSSEKIDSSFFTLSNRCERGRFEATLKSGFILCSLSNR